MLTEAVTAVLCVAASDDTLWADASGGLSPGAVLTLLTVFDEFDVNRDGFWSLQELNRFQVFELFCVCTATKPCELVPTPLCADACLRCGFPCKHQTSTGEDEFGSVAEVAEVFTDYNIGA